ncbi:MAG: CPBP family intramembrane metalloprotease [Clostridia bacterium]|nr:CPBP family intramembrane metalloprotease [Clostridia bacterium]
MKAKKRLRGILSALIYFIIYCLIQYVAQGVYVVYCKANSIESFSELHNGLQESTFALSVISSIVSLWIYALIGKIRKEPLTKTIKNNKVAPATMFMAVVCAVGARLVVSAYFHFANDIPVLKKSIENSALQGFEFTYAYQVLIALFLIIIIGPLFEEILFRGLIMNEFLKIMRPWAAIVLQAVFFGVVHFSLFQSSFALVVGVILGIIYFRTQSIKTVAVCHGVFNFTAFFSEIAKDMQSAIIILIFGIVITAISLFYIIGTYKSK